MYEKALHERGYDYELQYRETTNQGKPTNPKRRITWYKVSFGTSIVGTNVGREFLHLIKNCFHA